MVARNLKPVRDIKLDKYFSKLNDDSFNGKIRATPYWGIPSVAPHGCNGGLEDDHAPPASYEESKGEVSIIIHQYLLARSAPKYVVLYLLHHECLHQVYEPEDGDPHGPLFREQEVLIPNRDKAIGWLKKSGFSTVDW